jgi:hypothetical protein
LSFHSDAIEAGRESTAPCFSAKRPGPQGTIAKETGERKEKRKKCWKNARFLGGVWKSPLKLRLDHVSPRKAPAKAGAPTQTT